MIIDLPLRRIWQHVVNTVSSISQTSMSPNPFPTEPHKQSWITVMIFKRTTSSPDESLASNLQCDIVLLSSIKVASNALEFWEIKPHTKKLCNADSAAEVIGPVESGERRIAKNGERRPVSSASLTSVAFLY